MLWTAALCSFLTLTTHAQQYQPSGSDEEDFAVQGEYVGQAQLDGSYSTYTGLQVVALGGGKFDAVLYRGGLPGAGWDRTTKWKLSGQRTDQTVSLAGQHRSVRLRPSSGVADEWMAEVVNQAGQTVGTLRKIHRTSPTMGAPPPYGAITLFDGTPPEHLEDATLTDDGLLNVGVTTKEPVGAFRLHMEFRTPFEPTYLGQKRGNSGVYIQRRYEVQILDSFGLEGKHNECAGLYKQRRPDVNMCLPPRSWQTYDIHFTPARFDSEGNKTANARITVLHNGVAVHDNVEITSKTGNGRPEAPEKLPILWQNHRNPVHFRNMWIVHHADSTGPSWSLAPEFAYQARCTYQRSYRRGILGRVRRGGLLRRCR